MNFASGIEAQSERRKSGFRRRSTDASAEFKRYPTTHIDIWRLKDGTRVTLRPVLPQDAPLLADLVTRLSPATKRNRFHGAVNELTGSRQNHMSCVDYDKHVAFVIAAELDGKEHVIAEARYVVDSSRESASAEFALLIDDAWMRCGLGERAMRALIKTATLAGLRWLHGAVLAENLPMISLMRKCGFGCTPDRNDDNIIRAEIALSKSHRNLISAPKKRHSSAVLAKMRRWVFALSIKN